MFETREISYIVESESPGFQETVAEYQAETQNPGIGIPEIQFDRYKELNATGSIKCVGAFEGGELVGLAHVTFARSQHYPFPIASIESFYLRKSFRKGMNGLKFLRAVKKMVKASGAPGLVFMAPPGSDYDKLCERLGMLHTHNAWWCKS